MGNMVSRTLAGDTQLGKFYENKKVLITGHTGFKGSWLSLWLSELGADVIGYSLPPKEPSNFLASGVRMDLEDFRRDIRDADSLTEVLSIKPDIIFHLAAQPIVLEAYKNPVETFDTNVMGTVNLLSAIRDAKIKTSLVAITSDKCYENKEWIWGYRENDRLGGKDPYSASKAMAELAIASFRESFFNPAKYNEHGVAIASARAGNVIGGGDFADFRLVPDIARALSRGEPIKVRNPKSTRPWQHVLEPLSGYLWLAQNLHTYPAAYSEAWNFGPRDEDAISCKDIAEKAIKQWGSGSWEDVSSAESSKESHALKLNCDKSKARLSWSPVYSIDEALRETISWYKSFYSENPQMRGISLEQIENYSRRAKDKGLYWAQ